MLLSRVSHLHFIGGQRQEICTAKFATYGPAWLLGASWGPECLGGLSMSGIDAETKQVIALLVLLRPPMFLGVTHLITVGGI